LRQGAIMTTANHVLGSKHSQLSAGKQSWRKKLLLLALGAGFLPGCGTFFDDIRARSPEPGLWNNINYRTKLAFNMHDPMELIADEDGDMRRRGYLNLKEPKAGTEEHTQVLGIMRKAASQEKEMIVRMAVIARLGQFQDERCTQILLEAWQAPANSGEASTPVRMAIVRALGRRSDPAGLQIIATALQKNNSPDLRLTATDALAGFKEVEAAGTLIQVLREEKDISLKNRAHLSLQKMTGKNNVPPTAEAWETAVRGSINGNRVTKENNPTLILANWWQNE
jgi:hypothetical protein